MRALAPLLILLSLAAACGGGTSHPTSTATPSPVLSRTPTPTLAPAAAATLPQFTPEEEILTPPPDIDTSGWQTYQDTAHGFELRYPPDAKAKQSVLPKILGAEGTGAEIDLPFASGTTLEGKWVFVGSTNLVPDTCIPDQTYRPIVLVHAGEINFWRVHSAGGAAGHSYLSTVYVTTNRGTCLMIDGMLSEVSQHVFGGTPPPTPDNARETATFAAIVATFRWTSP